MKYISRIIVFLLFTVLLCGTALADTAFDASLHIEENADGSITVAVVDSEANNTILADKQPTLTVACDFTYAKVTGPDGAVNYYSGTGSEVSFTVYIGGAYLIESVSSIPGSDDTGANDPGGGNPSGGNSTITPPSAAEDTSTLKVTISGSSISDAAAAGKPVTLPVEPVAVPGDSPAAPAIEITVLENTSNVKIEIPVENSSSGMVAVIVHADGTEEIVKTSVASEDGIVLTVDGDVTVKIIDNSLSFDDVHDVDHWATEHIDFVTARELFTGKTADTFAPSTSASRAQVMTVLARLEGVDTSVNPLQAGINWAIAEGISDGTNAHSAISRQQLAVMLWRYAGCPESDHALDTHKDHDSIADYAKTALSWAVENGILGGFGDNTLRPSATASRAHLAAMVSRFIQYLA